MVELIRRCCGGDYLVSIEKARRVDWSDRRITSALHVRTTPTSAHLS
jgi:hypothetical protein